MYNFSTRCWLYSTVKMASTFQATVLNCHIYIYIICHNGHINQAITCPKHKNMYKKILNQIYCTFYSVDITVYALLLFEFAAVFSCHGIFVSLNWILCEQYVLSILHSRYFVRYVCIKLNLNFSCNDCIWTTEKAIDWFVSFFFSVFI